ncbi:MAG: hypothetical protein ACK4YQ_12260 [Phenylobacterium sp.]|uniref:hypothetical protein n=1 Tax=Phenylobacterium sp. TaxID=1871053 RepID=UPI00391A247E
MAGHALVVGGTGMLAGAVRGLALDGWRVSVLARGAESFVKDPGAPVDGFDCDYQNLAAFDAALRAAEAANGRIGLAVAWFHTLKIEAPRRLAEAVGAPGEAGLYVQVLGSGVADPARPDRLRIAADVSRGLPDCRLSQVILGFEIEGGAARWLTHAEISTGVLRAIRDGAPLSVIGRTEPWAARPTG